MHGTDDIHDEKDNSDVFSRDGSTDMHGTDDIHDEKDNSLIFDAGREAQKHVENSRSDEDGNDDETDDDANDDENDDGEDDHDDNDEDYTTEDDDGGSSVSTRYSDTRNINDGYYSPIPSESSEVSDDEDVGDAQEEDEEEDEGQEEDEEEDDDPIPIPNANPNPTLPHPIPQASLSIRRQDMVSTTVSTLFDSRNISIKQQAQYLDTVALNLLLFGASAKDVQPLTTKHRLTVAYRAAQRRGSIGQQITIPIQSYSQCPMCDHLKLIETVNCGQCKKKHNNLVVHLGSTAPGVIRKTVPLVCSFDKAPHAPRVKACPQELGKLVNGKVKPVRQIHMTRVSDWMTSVFNSPTIEADLKARFEFVEHRPQPNGSNFTCEYWQEFENYLPPGSLDIDHWYNLVLFLNVDWYGKSRNVHGNDEHLGGMYISILNLLPGQQHHPKFVIQVGTMEGKEPKQMSHIMDVVYEEMRQLSKHGLPIVLRDGRKIQPRAFLVECICDSEGKHKVAGHKSKNHEKPCIDCEWSPNRGVKFRMHANFNMSREIIGKLQNGDFDRNRNFRVKKYMEKWKKVCSTKKFYFSSFGNKKKLYYINAFIYSSIEIPD